MSLKDKVVLVTGSSRGIGCQTAVAFAEAGAKVIVHGHAESDKLDEAYNEVVKKSSQSSKLPSDLSQPDAIRLMFAAIESRYGRLNVLVNNAVRQNHAPFIEMTETDWDSVMQVNLKAPFLCSQLAAKLMIRQGGGKIINVG